MKLFVIRDVPNHSVSVAMPLLRLSTMTDFSEQQFDDVASLAVGATLKLDEGLSVQRAEDGDGE